MELGGIKGLPLPAAPIHDQRIGAEFGRQQIEQRTMAPQPTM
jgi:hypothetical protein